jgi:short subunit dehydrogenase-like uncharacterized protein
LQVSLNEAKLLAAAKKGSKLVIVNGMNNVLKEGFSDLQVNMATYSNPGLPLVPRCAEAITHFLSLTGSLLNKKALNHH